MSTKDKSKDFPDLFEVLVEAWKVYHLTANKYDGGIQKPSNPREGEIVAKGKKEAEKAMNIFLARKGLVLPTNKEGKELLQKAKEESINRHGK